MISLGRKYDSPAVPSPAKPQKESFPSLYISGVKGIEFPEGKFRFSGEARVISESENHKTGECSYELEMLSVDPKCCEMEDSEDSGLDNAMKKIEKKKIEEDSD